MNPDPVSTMRLPAASSDVGSLSARALWLAAAKTLAFAFNFALPLLLVRQLTVSDFGLYKQVFLIVSTTITVLPLGFAMSAFYFWPREPGRRDAVVFNILLFHLLMTGVAALALACRPALLAEIFHGPGLVGYGRAIGLIVLLWGVSSFLETIAIANGETRLAAALIVSFQLTKAVLLLGAAVWWRSVEALVQAAVVQGVLQIGMVLAYLSWRFGRFWRGFDPALMRAQLAYALPHGLAAWLYWVHMDLHNYFVAHRFDAATYAIYAVGCFQLPLLGILTESVGSVAIPRVSELQKEGRSRDILALSARMMRKLAAVCFPLFAFLLVSRSEFITVLFTANYASAASIFAVNLTLVPLAIVATAGDAVIRAYAEHRFFLVKLRLALTALTLTGLWIGTARFGLLGAVGVVVLASLIDRFAVAVKVGKILGLRATDLNLFKDLAKLGAASAVAGLIAAAARNFLLEAGPMLVLVWCAFLFGLAYLVLLVLWRVPTAHEREAVLRQIERLYRRQGKKAVDSVA